MAADTRDRMIEAAVEELRRSGVAGMSFTDVLARSGAARGAIYHHFPGGKTQLVTEAAARNGVDIRAHLAALPTAGPAEVVSAFLDAVRPAVEASTRGYGCAVAAVAMHEGADDGALRAVAATAFGSWAEQLATGLTAAGMRKREAADLAVMLVNLLEGAHVLCRAAGSLRPFDQAARGAVELVRARYEIPRGVE